DLHRAHMDRHRLRGQRPAVAGGDEECRLGTEATEWVGIPGTTDVVDHQKHPSADQPLAEVRARGGDGLEGRRVLFRPTANQIANPGQTAGRVDLFAHGGPEDAAGKSLANLFIVTELDGQRGLAESSGAVNGRGDAHGRTVPGLLGEQSVADLRELAALDKGLAGRGHTSI